LHKANIIQRFGVDAVGEFEDCYKKGSTLCNNAVTETSVLHRQWPCYVIAWHSAAVSLEMCSVQVRASFSVSHGRR